MSTFKRALLQLHLFVFLAGLTGPIGYMIQLNGLVLVFYRMSITVLALLVIGLFAKPSQKVSSSTKITLLGIGSIIALHWVCFYASIKLANVSIALVCFSCTSLFTSLLEPVISSKKMEWKNLLLGALSLLGILLIFHFDIQFRTGILVGLLSAFLAAIFSIINKNVTQNIDTFTIQFYEMLGGVIILSTIILIYNLYSHTSYIWPQKMDWFWLTILALVCTVGSNHLMLSALKHISAFTLNVTLNMEPVYGILLAFVFFKEQKQLGISFYIGFSLIALSVLIQMYRITQQQRNSNTLATH
ncbi:MAG: DMT family transporter [Chitinophagaceae bacterium]|nr:MAG: DMT family transporter [Chitinophagaceae bacterium]